MLLQNLKWREVDALNKQDVLVVCCIGALEQHSLHLPLGTDFLIGAELMRRLEERFTRQLVCLPPVWMGCSSHHLDFSGTVSVSIATLAQVMGDIVASIHQHGFRKMLLLNSHGGNRAVMGCAIQDLGAKYPDLTLAGVTYWDVAKGDLEKIRTTGFGGMGHACELETSVVLAFARNLVDMQQAVSDGTVAKSAYSRGEMLSPPAVTVYRRMADMSRHGGYGDPEGCTAEQGERMLAAIVEQLSGVCTDILANRI
jgi:creatinine amidohydrolase